MLDDSPILIPDPTLESLTKEEIGMAKSLSEIKTRNSEELVHKSVEIHQIGDKINQKHDIIKLSEWLANFESFANIKETQDLSELATRTNMLLDCQSVFMNIEIFLESVGASQSSLQ